MSERIPPEHIDAAFPGSEPTPETAAPAPARVRVVIYAPNGDVQALEGIAALVGVLLGEQGDKASGAQWFANINHMTGAMILANLITLMRQHFGEQSIKAALELSRQPELRDFDGGTADATGGP
jgi:hypothetical protein